MTSDWKPQFLFTVFLLSILFSIQYPLPGVGSKFASINAADIVLVGIGLFFVSELHLSDHSKIELGVPKVTGWFVILSVWIILSVIVAAIRGSVSVLPNVLWMLKWIEIGGFLLLTQIFSNRVDWGRLLNLLIVCGGVIGTVATFQTLTSTGQFTQSTVFWENPNTLAVFLALPTLLGILNGSSWSTTSYRKSIASYTLGTLSLLGLLTSGSRSGMITLVIGGAVAAVLLYSVLDIRIALGGPLAGGLIAGGSLLITRPWLLKRYIPIYMDNGNVTVNQAFIGGLESRLQLTRKAIDLWTDRPFIGYGWFSSPESPIVGYLDMFYTQLLVDIGIIGLAISLAFYISFFRSLVQRQASGCQVVPAVGAGWLAGLLAAGIGGAHARVPRIMFLLMILLVAASSLNSDDRELFWL